ncbi:MAG: tRNA dihydrouridine synthase DusB [Clostridiaceae bacterium]
MGTKTLPELIGRPESAAPVFLAPMAGVTDLPFRALCASMGADFTYTEMVSAKGLSYGGKNSFALLETAAEERPCGVQLFGSEPAVMADMARMLSERYVGQLAVIDINMGCPARKITSNREGSALMLDPLRASRIISAVVKASSLPVTVKFRKGYDQTRANAPEFARMAEESGASAVTVHGRTREQMYAGKADWDSIAAVKRMVKIPVIGNGDVFSGADAAALLKHTGCDGVMVARGAQGNPFLFSEIKAALRGQLYEGPSDARRIETAILHVKAHVAHKGERAVIEMRKHAAWYVRGMKDSASVRARINACATAGELCAVLAAYERTLLQGSDDFGDRR